MMQQAVAKRPLFLRAKRKKNTVSASAKKLGTR